MSNEAGLPQWRAQYIVNNLNNGGVIAYPTEGVWGLGCLPELPTSVAHILGLKQRRWQDGLILIASDILHFQSYLDGLPALQIEKLQKTWPGPVTFLVPDNGAAPSWIRGHHDSVALRVSAHPVVRSLCNCLGGPLVSTSANPSGRMPALSALRVRQFFGDEIDLIVAGELSGSGASEIRDLVSDKVLRPATV